MVKPRTLMWLTAVVAVAAVLFFVAGPVELLARAGGGHGGGGHGGGGYGGVHGAGYGGGYFDNGYIDIGVALLFALGILIYIYSGIVRRMALRKSRQCQALMKRASVKEPAWREETLKPRIEQAFYAIERAWMARNHEKGQAIHERSTLWEAQEPDR